MAPSMVDQFTEMLDACFSLGDKANPTHKPRKMIRETITYPKLVVKQANDSCLNLSLSFEHVLSCGHVVSTALPNEPCAPNCHHVPDDGRELDRSLRYKKAMKMKNGKNVSDKVFYCDACVEEEFEVKVPVEISASDAEERRVMLRAIEAKTRGKATRFRKCYIALKVTSVPCHRDGTLSLRYMPCEKRHPFDLALPQSGENMFEDIDPGEMIEEGITTKPEEEPIMGTREVRVTKAKEDSARTIYSLVLTDDEYTENDTHGVNEGNQRFQGREQRGLTRAAASTPRRAPARGIVLPKTAYRVTAGNISGSLEAYDDFQAVASEGRPRKRNNYCLDEDSGNDSQEDGEIITKSNKDRRIVPVTCQTAKNRAKIT